MFLVYVCVCRLELQAVSQVQYMWCRHRVCRSCQCAVHVLTVATLGAPSLAATQPPQLPPHHPGCCMTGW